MGASLREGKKMEWGHAMFKLRAYLGLSGVSGHKGGPSTLKCNKYTESASPPVRCVLPPFYQRNAGLRTARVVAVVMRAGTSLRYGCSAPRLPLIIFFLGGIPVEMFITDPVVPFKCYFGFINSLRGGILLPSLLDIVYSAGL